MRVGAMHSGVARGFETQAPARRDRKRLGHIALGDYEQAVTSGTIVEQDPPAGSVVASDTPVALSVNPGPADEMPHLLGKQLGEAHWLLKERGLAVSFVQTRALKGVEPGLVVAQRPGGGTNVRRQAMPITLVISRPPLPGEFNRPRPRTELSVPQ